MPKRFHEKQSIRFDDPAEKDQICLSIRREIIFSSGNSGRLLRPRPLRTVRETFTSYGSGSIKAA